jgi:hypothetical protein
MEISVWELWLPIVISGVALFFASAAAWMLLPHHKTEWTGLPNEEVVVNALKGANVPAGQYMFPHAKSPEDYKSDEFKRRLQAGPNGTLCLWNGMPSMGANMACTVFFFLVTSFVIAYLATMALPAGAEFMRVFQFVGTAGILTYGTANILNGIWFRREMVADIIDGVAFGLITGVIFGLLWPGTAT